MSKQIFAIIGIILVFFSFAFAQQQDTLTITTYYPSPYGSYNELTTYSNTYLAITSGNVGIGTTAPLGTLHVQSATNKDITWATGSDSSGGEVTIGDGGTANTSSLWVNTPGVNATHHSGLGVRGSLSGNTSIININAYGTNSTGGYGSILAFSTTNDQTLSEWMRIDKSGNVGIGTAGPGAKLEIYENLNGDLVTETDNPSTGTSANARFIARNNAGGAMALTAFGSNYNLVSGYGGIGAVMADSSLNALSVTAQKSTGYIRFDTGGYNERMRIDNNGNVGIGTTNPGAKLEVAGQVKITGGSPGAGKVLTSDANGLASWQSSLPTIVVGTAIDNNRIYVPSGYTRSECIAIASCMTNYNALGSPAFAGQRAEMVNSLTEWLMGCGYYQGDIFKPYGTCGYVISCQK